MNHKSPTGCRPGQLFGLWMMDAERLEAYRARAVAVDLAQLARMNAEAAERETQERAEMLANADPSAPPPKPYPFADGVAVIDVSGPTTKYLTSFQRMLGGTSTMEVQHLLRAAKADPDVKAVLMHFDDAPGGTVAGAFELWREIRSFAQAKPIRAHVDDLGTSAAYLFASATQHVTANPTGFVGSIGVRSALIDSSEQFKKEGVRVVPLARGKFKTMGMPGTPVTAEHEAEGQKHIDDLTEHFVAAVAETRGLDPQAIRDMEARLYLAADAKANGLIDGVDSFEAAFAACRAIANPPAPTPHQQHQQTSPPTAERGAAGAGHAHAAPSDRSSDMELLAKMREILGAPQMTEEQAVDRVRALHTAAANAPKPVDASLLAERGELACERVDALLEGAKILPPQADRLKKLFMGDDGRKPNAALLGEGQSYKAVLAAVAAGDRSETDKAADRLRERKELRVEDRETPGGDGTPGADAGANDPKALAAKAAKQHVDGRQYAGPKPSANGNGKAN